jgi:hypothetical protein
MISIKNQIPSIYYDASRDFQILGHLFEIVLNYSKTNADMLYMLPDGIKTDTRATELLAMTLGFKLRRNYDKDQLAALVSIFPRLLKIKGTIQAVRLAGNALIKASGVTGYFESTIEDNVLTIKIPQELSDITLFMDLLPYILPFGIRVSIIRTTVLMQTSTIELGVNTVVRTALSFDKRNPNEYEQYPLGLARVSVSDDVTKLEYSNNGFIDDNGSIIATGLLGATPVMTFDPSEATAKKDEEAN